MDINELLEPFVRMLDAAAPPAVVRAIEHGGSAAALWDEIAQSGFLDALVAEEYGGAGLSLADIEPLIEALGARAVPLPVAETIVARALLASAGVAAPDGPIALVTSLAQPVPCGLVAQAVLFDRGDALVLCEMAQLSPEQTGVTNSLAARISGNPEGQTLPRPGTGLRPIAAVLRAALIAGAAARLCDVTTAYASERVQFGKPIGRQQSLQQMLAVMAEDMIACRIAAQLGASHGLEVPLAAAATAKITTSSAAPRIAATAHAVHGAIGISEEYDLQLLTRRLHEWRMADGSEGYWSRVLGQQRLATTAMSVDWIRQNVFA
ncbi:acyl-CoA dehydrogenase [Novosphingobium taihuense]|uniref:Acyl-CoA dehydrogenase n=1 Tax=Novosphingobium taihuense TaxID=260085 RepID=A0A7W7ABN4_9SPHN|nr:acyl-CoA dehydrogenase [Novosphingobium taihuense]MBB4613942.1 acyl-CoA dehydrogenase [Novosphingobium taihuense]TWH86793.1 acyl-CoA dehydrogenase-like protein [Novosphingobium taihuense]